MLTRRSGLLVILTVATAISCAAARKPGTVIKPGFNLFSKDQDIQLGKEAAAQVSQQYQVVQNRQLQEYIGSIGQKLARQPDAGGYPYTFTLLNDPSVNAFALPGGPAFVFTGLLKAADNEAQLAGVLAHEIAHVALRHGTKQASKANLIQLPAMLAGAVVGNGGLLGQLTQLGIGLGANSVLLKYSRDAENQADLLGAKIMSEAGYNPIEMAPVFREVAGRGRRPRAAIPLGSSQSGQPREERGDGSFRRSRSGPTPLSSGDFAQMRALAAQLPAPPKKPQQGASSAAPSGSAQPGGAAQPPCRSIRTVPQPGSQAVHAGPPARVGSLRRPELQLDDYRSPAGTGAGPERQRGDRLRSDPQLLHPGFRARRGPYRRPPRISSARCRGPTPGSRCAAVPGGSASTGWTRW